MGKLQEFINILEEQVKNHSIYIWGAQGQCYPTVTEKWIKAKESGRVFWFIQRRYFIRPGVDQCVSRWYSK
jgi:hypothetical protein